ncbi:helix-turn-helix domain-containing protein [Leucobacter insecticola]|uniref:Helix-turn-helix domain-containing protein n=1 Tax=Leucobacter insecticola TaxID=2714934 RepID=A0A6G8FFR8_9MICO|nr:helix-turn-helix domain-containing protein [Leucobacter insecticola]
MMVSKEMDEVIHAPARLRIMSVLVELGPDSEITFARLQSHLDMTPGNLSAHIKRLERVHYLAVSKGFTARGVAQTSISVTLEGMDAFNAYVEQLKSIIGPR